MPKTAFHTLRGEESELKQHGCVFQPETSSAPEQNAGVCRQFEGKSGYKQRSCTKRFETASCSSESDTASYTQSHCRMHTCSCKGWALCRQQVMLHSSAAPYILHIILFHLKGVVQGGLINHNFHKKKAKIREKSENVIKSIINVDFLSSLVNHPATPQDLSCDSLVEVWA